VCISGTVIFQIPVPVLIEYGYRYILLIPVTVYFSSVPVHFEYRYR
jgi:hypothetical protein